MSSTAPNEFPVRNPRAWRTDEERWSAVQQRERAADGAFFYSVRTTGVYCRPSCAARMPLRRNVRFHGTAADAEAAGFRACKRCRPGEPDLAARRAAAVAAACRLIERSETLPRVAELASAVAMSRFHFQRVFKDVTGLTPQSYARERRAERLRAQLRKGAPVTDAIYAAGFNSSGRFYAQAGKTLGMPARDYRAGGANAKIRFAVGECSLGAIVVAASERGVCAILLGDDAAELTRELEDRFPNAQLAPGDRDFAQWVARVVGLVEAPQLGCDLPLDIRGSAFEQRVWRALRAIPAGSTASYSEIAAAIGAPTSRAPLRARARPTRSQSRSRATAWCAATAPWRAIGGASSASARCSTPSAPTAHAQNFRIRRLEKDPCRRVNIEPHSITLPRGSIMLSSTVSRRTLLAVAASLTFGTLALLDSSSASAQAAGAPLKIGIIGTGKIGGALARHWVKAGHEVFVSSRHPEELQDLVKELGPKAQAGTPKRSGRVRQRGARLDSLRRHAADR